MSNDVKYCERCWNLLHFSGADLQMICSYCDERVLISKEGSIGFRKIYRSKPNAFAGKIVRKSASDSHLSAGATIDETCPSCGTRELSFKTAQLRSADEGQAIFYHCLKCGYRNTLNT